MTPEKFESAMKFLVTAFRADSETRHIEMDALLCSQLKELGYEDGVKIFKECSKWYA
jgi:hypothetical protein